MLSNRGCITDLPFFENTISNLPKVLRAKSLGSDGLYAICKFASFKDPFATINSLCELYFRFRFIAGTNKKSYFYELWQQQ